VNSSWRIAFPAQVQGWLRSADNRALILEIFSHQGR